MYWKIRDVTLILFMLMVLYPSMTVIAQKNKVPFKEVTQIQEDKGLVYIYRKSGMSGAANRFLVYAGGVAVSKTKMASGTYLEFWAEPGSYTFTTEMQMNRILTVNILEGKAIYIESNCNGILEVVSEQTGRKRIKDCTMLVDDQIKKD